MNVFLWILQFALALLAIPGGAYKIIAFEAVAAEPFYTALPRVAWSVLGVVEIICGLPLLIPAWKRSLMPLAATVLAVESLFLTFLYGRYSTALTATNPFGWVVAMTAMAAIVAWGRYSRETRSRRVELLER